MRTIALSLTTLGTIVVFLLHPAPAPAQATRTWVSGVGDDANPCSRTAPCKTFAGAISKTLAGGEINVIDPGGFGAVTITKSITIDGGGTFASILASGTNGVIINAAATDTVTLRNLAINGAPGTGLVGIRFQAGGALHVENCAIMNFRSGAAIGIQFVPSGTSELYVSDTVVSENGSGGGIVIRPGTGTAKVMLDRVRAKNNGIGILADTTGNTGLGITMSVRDSVAAGNTNAGISAVAPPGGLAINLMIDRSLVANNGTGVSSNGFPATVRIGNSTVTGNLTGVSAINSSTMTSYKNNSINGNATDGTPLAQVNAN